jgi:hypothetical protein
MIAGLASIVGPIVIVAFFVGSALLFVAIVGLAVKRGEQVQRQFAGVVTGRYVDRSYGTYGELRQCQLEIRCDDGTSITVPVSAQVYRDMPVGCHVTKQPGRRWPVKTVAAPPRDEASPL